VLGLWALRCAAADPLDEWISPPFEPEERNGNLYARGAVDDKGQVIAQVKALESLLAATGKLPAECAGAVRGRRRGWRRGIASYVGTKPADLKADFALICDTELFARGCDVVRWHSRHDLYRA